MKKTCQAAKGVIKRRAYEIFSARKIADAFDFPDFSVDFTVLD